MFNVSQRYKQQFRPRSEAAGCLIILRHSSVLTDSYLIGFVDAEAPSRVIHTHDGLDYLVMEEEIQGGLKLLLA